MTTPTRIVTVITVGRSDYSILFPVLRKIDDDPQLGLRLIVSGMHLSPEFGLTVGEIEADGFHVSERIETLLSADTPQSIAKAIGLGAIGFSQAFSRSRPEILVVLGDRFEMYAAALAALPFKVPVAHIHGGEVTRGAIDDALRHSITKLSHLHFVATEEYARRVKQMGEESWRVHLSGAPSLDNIREFEPLKPEGLKERHGLRLESPFLLVTFHSVTLEYEDTEHQICELLGALSCFSMPAVFTVSNADTNGRLISRKVEAFSKKHRQVQIVANLGREGYLSLLARASAMVGNSSSGIIEAPSFGLPVVNIGRRQEGRVQAMNVINVGHSSEEIQNGIRKALRPDFRVSLKGLLNPYFHGEASELIVSRLKEMDIDDNLLRKKFVDLLARSTETRE